MPAQVALHDPTHAGYARAVSPRARWTLVALGIVLCAAVAVRLLVGAGGLQWPESATVWELRATRAGLGVAVGGALALAGVLMQCLLRNPLASPDILGPSSGAALAVVAAAALGGAGGGTLGTLAWQAGPAVGGALATLLLVYTLSQRRGLIEPTHLILVGVVVSIIAGAGVMFIQHLSPDAGFSAMRMLLGGLNDNLPAWAVVAGCAIVVVGVSAAAVWSHGLDAALLDVGEARSVGLRIGILRVMVFIGAGLLTALAVVLAGPVGFVGLVCPHVVRLVLGTGGGDTAGRHRSLVIGSALAGAALIVGADSLIKAVDLGAGRMPLGVLTALLGGPVLVMLLRRSGGVGGVERGPM